MPVHSIPFQIDSLKLVSEFYIPDTGSHHPILVMCHGIPAGAYDPSDRGYPLLAQRFCNSGVATFIFNFRGTGKSEGNLDILGWSQDLTAVLNILSSFKEVDTDQLSVLGFSAGAAVANYVAAHDKRIKRLILAACPAEFSFLVQAQNHSEIINHFRNIGLIKDEDFPPSLSAWLEGFARVSPILWIQDISPRPLLIIHGDKDEIVPLEHAQRLYQKAGEPKYIDIIPNAGHRLRLEERAINRVLNWLKNRA